MKLEKKLIGAIRTRRISDKEIREELRAFSEHDLNNLVVALEEQIVKTQESNIKAASRAISKKKKLQRLEAKRNLIIDYLNSLPKEPNDGRVAHRFHPLAHKLSESEYQILEEYEKESMGLARHGMLEAHADNDLQSLEYTLSLAKKLIRNLNLEDDQIIQENAQQPAWLNRSTLFANN